MFAYTLDSALQYLLVDSFIPVPEHLYSTDNWLEPRHHCTKTRYDFGYAFESCIEWKLAVGVDSSTN